MYSILKAKKKECIKLSLLIITGQVFLVISATINANALNELIALNWRKFLFQESMLLLVWSFIILFDWLVKNYKMNVIQDLDTELRERIATDLSNMSYQAFHSKSVGTYVSWLNNDIQTINKQGFEMFFLIIKGMSGTIFAVVTLIGYHWSLAVLTFISLIIMLAVPKLFGARMREASLKTTIQNEEFLKEAENTLNGFDVFASLNLLGIIPGKIRKASGELKTIALKHTRVEALVGSVGFSCNIFFQILLTVFTGYLAFIGVVTIGTIEATGALTGIIFTTLGELSTQLSAINGTKPIFEKFKAISTKEEQWTAVEANDKNQMEMEVPLFVAKRLSYKYGNQTILSNLSFAFHKNGKYLISGSSGSGKTTLLKILNGFLRDYSGSVKFNGLEINTVTNKEIIKNVLLLDQQPYLLSGTVRENILLDESFSDEEISVALAKAGLSKELATPNFLDYQVGDNGRLLSGGQKQRIALARGLLREKRIILIDEGTSAIDQENSIEIEKNILKQNDLTVIMITHSPHKELLDYFTRIINFPEDIS